MAHKKHVYPLRDMIKEIARLDASKLSVTDIEKSLQSSYGEAPSKWTIQTFMPSHPKYDKKKAKFRLAQSKRLFRHPSKNFADKRSPAMEKRLASASATAELKLSPEAKQYLNACGTLLDREPSKVIDDLVVMAKKIGALKIHGYR